MRRTGGRRYRGREEGSLLSAASLLQTARPATVGRIRCGPATGGRSAAGIFCGTCRAGHAGAAGRQGPQQVGARRGARRGRRMGGRCTFSLVVVALRLVDAHLLADVFILLPERVEEVGDPRHPHRAPEHLPAVHLLPRRPRTTRYLSTDLPILFFFLRLFPMAQPYGAVAPVYAAVAPVAAQAAEKKQRSATVAGVVSVVAFFAVLALAVHSWPSKVPASSRLSAQYWVSVVSPPLPPGSSWVHNSMSTHVIQKSHSKICVPAGSRLSAPTASSTGASREPAVWFYS